MHRNTFKSKSLYNFILNISLVIILFFSFPINTFSLEVNEGENIFMKNCSSCHMNGGNIIRRGKTLKLKALKKNGLISPEDIAKVAREGTGIMSGYSEAIGEGGDQLVALWIWEQAQNAWIHG